MNLYLDLYFLLFLSCFSWWDRAYSCRHPLCSLHWCYCWSPHQTLRSQNRISDIFSLHWSNNNANLLKVLHRCVRQKMIKIIPQGRKESWRLQVPQTGGPLSESFKGDLILLNNAAVHRAHKSRSIGPVHLLVESCDGVIGRLFYCSGWRRVD